MKLCLAFAVLSLVVWSAPSFAAEGPRDLETDHVDAYDSGGKPSVGVFANPGALLVGALAADVEVALGDAAALSLEADCFGLGSPGGLGAYGGLLGMPIFVERVRFHGLYVEPRIAVAHASVGGASASAVGMGATAGWEETWRFGLSLKGGVGVLYETALQGGAASALVIGVRPLVDAAFGWVF